MPQSLVRLQLGFAIKQAILAVLYCWMRLLARFAGCVGPPDVLCSWVGLETELTVRCGHFSAFIIGLGHRLHFVRARVTSWSSSLNKFTSCVQQLGRTMCWIPLLGGVLGWAL